MVFSGRTALISTDCGTPEGISEHKARLKGPDFDSGVGTLILSGTGSHWRILKHSMFGVSPVSHIPRKPLTFS